MKQKFFPFAITTIALAFGLNLSACDSGGNHAAAETTENDASTSTVVPVDYSQGRAMNARLGKGINLGNSWDSDGYDDGGWNNPIEDSDFSTIAAAGFNSVRLPVRWQVYSDYTTHTVDPSRMAGVIEDIQLAMANGLAVVVNFHHYGDLNCYGGGMPPNYTPPDDNPNCQYQEEKFLAEKTHFLMLWAQVAATLNATFPANDMLVFEILNEPVIANAERVDTLLNDAYSIIRAAAPEKTIMFEAYHAAKFGDLDKLHLPPDGNIIYSGHYYEPMAYSHQGHNVGVKCVGDDAYANTAIYDLADYVKKARQLYPDVNGVDHVPMNMGEFGISGGGDFANTYNCDGDNSVLPSAKKKALWAQKTVAAAESNSISWHYWGFTKVGGFEAYSRSDATWYDGFPTAFGL